MERKSTKAKRRRAKAKKREFLIVAVIAVIIVIALFVFTLSLRKTVSDNNEKIARIESQIAEESERANDLKQQEDFMKTDEFIEKIARERLGLVSPNEILIKPEN